MASVNKVILLGNVGKDPELRYTNSGAAVCNFTLATNKKGKEGEEDRVEWHRCVAWKATAEAIHKYVRKGDPLYIEGELQTRKYDRDGQTHYSTEIVAWNVQFLRGKRSEEGGERAESAPAKTSTDPASEDYDIPF